jgi:hypothetical protein
MMSQIWSQRRVALTGAVLHRGGSALGHQVADRTADHVERQAADIRHAPGE